MISHTQKQSDISGITRRQAHRPARLRLDKLGGKLIILSSSVYPARLNTAFTLRVDSRILNTKEGGCSDSFNLGVCCKISQHHT